MAEASPENTLDVVIVGAGFAGMYALHSFRGMGLQAKVLEAGNDVGGTWYWNRYPGARCDVPSVEYSYSFDKDLEQEWNWTEIMAAQPEILEYASHVADRFDLRKDMQFQTRVTRTVFDESSSLWQVVTDAGETYRARFCIMATGCLSVPNTPSITGQESFAGAVYHTGNWPEAGVDFSGLNVGIIGTGSSGIQSIPVIAEQAAHLTVFQRTPNYTMPAANARLKSEFLQQAKENYPNIRAEQRASQVGIVGYGFGFGGAENVEPTEEIRNTTEEERQRLVEEEGFLAIRRYADVSVDEEANELACDMYRRQVARVIQDPETADALMPRDYPMGCKRPVIDTDYYETFNRENVTLVDLRKGGIERITPQGVSTAQGEYAFDVLVYATGFDAMTGALGKIDIRGRQDVALKDYWEAGPRTYLGLQVAGFPNLFTVTGPGSPSVLSNMIVSIEQHVDWIAQCIADLDRRGAKTIEATSGAEDAWIAHVNEVAENTMFTAQSCNSWYLGANIPGKPRIFMPYVGGVGVYREKCAEVAKNDYEGFLLQA
jgi:cyclohexanone monooxygenase